MMRNVLKTLSLSVLFGISACAVDEPTDEATDDATTSIAPSWQRDEEQKGDDANDKRAQYCEHDDECESKFCDTEQFFCRDVVRSE